MKNMKTLVAVPALALMALSAQAGDAVNLELPDGMSVIAEAGVASHHLIRGIDAGGANLYGVAGVKHDASGAYVTTKVTAGSIFGVNTYEKQYAGGFAKNFDAVNVDLSYTYYDYTGVLEDADNYEVSLTLEKNGYFVNSVRNFDLEGAYVSAGYSGKTFGIKYGQQLAQNTYSQVEGNVNLTDNLSFKLSKVYDNTGAKGLSGINDKVIFGVSYSIPLGL